MLGWWPGVANDLEPASTLLSEPAFEALTSSLRLGRPGVRASIAMTVQDLALRAPLEECGSSELVAGGGAEADTESGFDPHPSRILDPQTKLR